MDTTSGEFPKSTIVDSALGKRTIDAGGAPVCAVRMEAAKAYAGIPGLLQKVIEQGATAAGPSAAYAGYGGAPKTLPEAVQKTGAAWEEITGRIDYIYDHLEHALAELDRETGLAGTVRSQVKSGKKLLFKPNLVGPTVIDPLTHGEGAGDPACTQWPLMAALMRWFHDRLDISYHQMALGEASTSTFLLADIYSKTSGKSITTEAVIEGRSGDFYGGWGFFFVRSYLAERHPESHTDDPMAGHAESVSGTFIAPGRATDRLMVYDLNKIEGEPSTGRTVAVPEGANFKEITLHKAVVGGDPDDPADLRDYPGCFLVNVPKLKIHAQDLITCAIKNLGIGLYPTRCASGKGGDASWKYAYPATQIPSYKGKLPHSPWVVSLDEATHLPVKDGQGEYVVTRTAGFSGTQSDVIRAVQSQKVSMIHLVDAIDAINISHNPDGKGVRVPEGFVWASPDCVALDLFCARYCFKTVPMAEALELKEKNGWPTEFVHRVPVARVEGKNILTWQGVDSPLFRYHLYDYAQQRGVGQQKYHVAGWDGVTGTPLASLGGHLGRVEKGAFVELMTTTMYYNPMTILHDLQATVLSYARAHDQVTGSSLLGEFLDCFDENGDGVIDYDEKGRSGVETGLFCLLGHTIDLKLTTAYGFLKGSFLETSFIVKHSEKGWNGGGHDFTREKMLAFKAAAAFEMSRAETVSADPFVPGMSFGKGGWPSWQTVGYALTTGFIYGAQSPEKVALDSLYGQAFQYADKTQQGGLHTGSTEQSTSRPDALNRYFKAVAQGAAPLDFVLYVPAGYGTLQAAGIPNVEETADPGKLWTAHFNKGEEVW